MQTNLFGEIETSRLTIEQAAKIANVSTATIRNWIKTGYLTQINKGFIPQESLNNFMSNIAGNEKLNSRANKSLKDRHNHEQSSAKTKLLTQKFSGETIGTEYEKLLSDSYRNKEGIYYTPSWVVKDMFQKLIIKPGTKFLDPCCGSGNFIVEAIKAGVSPENVYGYDIDINAVYITKERIRKEFGYETENIKVGNFLNEAISLKTKNESFDFILTNPPWGKKIEKLDKKKIAEIYGCGNSLDTTSLFLGASLSILSEKGILGFLIQEAFFNISTFEDIRKKTISKNILHLIDYGKAFKGLVTRAQAIIFENSEPNTDSSIKCKFNNASYYRSLKSFKDNPKHILNFWITEKESQVIDKLYSTKHITLQDNAKWALGIVTGNNKKYCRDSQEKDYIPIYKGADITKSGLKNPTSYILNNFSNFQQVAPLEMYQADEKLIYKFISSDLCFYCDNQKRFILNSANLLIPINIGITAKQLTELLNSEILNWLFRKLFSTHKVLRGDLELLPIHTEYFLKNKNYSEETYLKYLQIIKLKDGTFRIKS